MPVSTFDTLMQITTARAPEPTAPAGPSDRSFSPALEEAYRSQRPAAAPAVESTSPPERRETEADRRGPEESAPPREKPRADDTSPTEAADQAGTAEMQEDDGDSRDEDATGDDETPALAAAAALPAQKQAEDAKAAESAAAVDISDPTASASAEEGEPVPGALAGAGRGKRTGRSNSSGKAAEQAATGGAAAESGAEDAAPPQGAASGAAQGADAKLANENSQADSELATSTTSSTSGGSESIGESSKRSAAVGETAGDAAAGAQEAEGLPAPSRGEGRTAKSDGDASPAAAAKQQTELVTPTADNASPPQDAALAATTGGDDATRSHPGAASSTDQRGAATLERLAARAMRPGSPHAPHGEEGPSVDRTRFVQRVEGALRAAQQRDGRIHVRLSPPELGTLRIELAMHNGALTAHLEAETPAARNALLDNLPALRDRLAQQDIRIQQFEVDVRRDFSSGGGGHSGPQDGRADHSAFGRQEGRPRSPAPRGAASGSPAAPRVASPPSTGSSAIDVRV
jgi:flagellar hook-length control protein FliK